MGIAALAYAVIVRALDDALDGDQEAREWLDSEDCGMWLEALDVPHKGSATLDFVTVKDVQDATGIGQTVVNRAALDGNVAAYKHKNWKWMIDRRSANEWLRGYYDRTNAKPSERVELEPVMENV